MSRVKRGKSHLKHRKNLMKRVKGFQAGRKNLIKLAKIADTKAGVYAYADRRKKKRDFRGLWQTRLNAAARLNGASYSRLINSLKTKGVKMNRKVLSEIAALYPSVFAKIVR